MVVDTNVLIAFMAGEQEVIVFLSQYQESGRVLFLSSIVEAELLSFSDLAQSEVSIIEEFLAVNFTPCHIDSEIARLVGKIRRTFKIKLPDAFIAATALHLRTPLVTRNTKDFKHIPGLKLVSC